MRLYRSQAVREKPVAFKDGTVAVEGLPLPQVFYPGHYGSFFGFREEETGSIALCTCCKTAVENYLAFRIQVVGSRDSTVPRSPVLDKMHFPDLLVQELASKGAYQREDVMTALRFETGICHECNHAVPSYRYCHEMYGGVFKQTFGWYVNKQGYEYGVEPLSNRLVREVCPEEVLDLMEIPPEDFMVQYNVKATTDIKTASAFRKRYDQQTRRVWNAIENEVRSRLGHKKIGEAWTSETVLYQIVRQLVGDEPALRHHRPQFLEGLELDIYLPRLNLGIEYQGVQHFRPVRHWGGAKALAKTQARDSKKLQLCSQHGIRIVYFRYDEQLSSELIQERIGRLQHSTSAATPCQAAPDQT